jgi:hypothetical protein
MNEPQLRVLRAKEEIVTKEDASATIRNDAVEMNAEELEVRKTEG